MTVALWIAVALLALLIAAILYAPFILSGRLSREEEADELRLWAELEKSKGALSPSEMEPAA